VKTQRALKEDVRLAGEVGRRLFPAEEAALITDLIRRDLPFYDASISRGFVSAMTTFSRDVGILNRHPSYEEVVAHDLAPLWKA
jgi:hypothetical protein